MGIFPDRSDNNGVDDYKLAHATHLYAKITDGISSSQASAYKARVDAARAARAVTGAYHFAQNNDPRGECDFFIDTLTTADRLPKPGDLRPAVDVERAQSVAWVEDFATHFRSRLGYWPTLYGNTSTIAPMRNTSAILRELPWWRAEYGADDGRAHPLAGGAMGCAIHQYTEKAVFAGISGFTDANIAMRGDLMLVPKRRREHRPPNECPWRWARWRLGIAEYEGHARDKLLRPKCAPRIIPISWWRKVRWYKRHSLA